MVMLMKLVIMVNGDITMEVNMNKEDMVILGEMLISMEEVMDKEDNDEVMDKEDEVMDVIME